MSKHTPGPWGFYVEPNGDSPIVGIVDDYETPHDIFRGEAGLDFDTTRANARLIAAAPDLLALALAILDRDIGNGELIRMARETIRKAAPTAPDSAPAP